MSENKSRTKQLSLFEEEIKMEFGGTLLAGKRKVKRPLDSKRPIHLVLKAASDDSILPNQKFVGDTIHRFATKFGLTIYSEAYHADHVHISLRISNQNLYNRWVRASTGFLSRILKIKWRLRPFTRVSAWGRDFNRTQNYVGENQLEGSFIESAHKAVADLREQALRAHNWQTFLAS